MIKGTYIFYEDGKEIYRQPNVITKFGKRFLTNVIAGNADSHKRDIAIGIGSNSATENDTRLQFEWYRLPVLFGSTDIQTDQNTGDTTYSVIYKATLPQNIDGQIKEIGLYPVERQSLNQFEDRFLSDFSDAIAWYDDQGFSPSSTYNTDSVTYSKIGSSVINFDSGAEYYTNLFLDLSGYSSNDSITIAYYKYDTHASLIKVKFYSSDTAYYEISLTPDSGTGHKISSEILLSSLFTNGVNDPDATKIFKIGIESIPSSGQSTVIGMDGLRVNDKDTFDPIYGIISRSVLTDAITKYAGRQLDVEYKVDMSYANN